MQISQEKFKGKLLMAVRCVSVIIDRKRARWGTRKYPPLEINSRRPLPTNLLEAAKKMKGGDDKYIRLKQHRTSMTGLTTMKRKGSEAVWAARKASPTKYTKQQTKKVTAMAWNSWADLGMDSQGTRHSKHWTAYIYIPDTERRASRTKCTKDIFLT